MAKKVSKKRRSALEVAPDRREQILEAAKAILVEEGYDGLSMRRVAARVGISSTALYLYFKEKEELLDTVCHRVFERLVPKMFELIAKDDDPLQLLREGLRLYISFGLQHPDEYRIVFLTRRPTESWDHLAPLQYVDRWGQERVNTFMFLIEGLRRCQVAGRIRAGDLKVMGETVLAGMHGLLALLILSPKQEWSAPEILIDAQVELIVRGLRPDPEP